jgi:hypothetical protein
VGVSYLQWLGLTLEPARAAQQGVPPYPHMLCWLNAQFASDPARSD